MKVFIQPSHAKYFKEGIRESMVALKVISFEGIAVNLTKVVWRNPNGEAVIYFGKDFPVTQWHIDNSEEVKICTK